MSVCVMYSSCGCYINEYTEITFNVDSLERGGATPILIKLEQLFTFTCMSR